MSKERKLRVSDEGWNQRDLQVLLSLERWGVLSVGQLDGLVFHREVGEGKRVERFFNSFNRKDYGGTAYRVLKELELGGFVKSLTYINLLNLYSLAVPGHKVLRKHGLNALPACGGEIAESLVRHELVVNAVGLVLSELLGLRVWTELERYLASAKNVKVRRNEQGFSDLWIEDEEQPKAVEIERTQKSADRYAKTWSAYRREFPRNSVVLYITCFPGGAGRLLRRARKLMADHIYVCDLEDFKSSLGRGPFVGYRGGEVELVPANGAAPTVHQHAAAAKHDVAFDTGVPS